MGKARPLRALLVRRAPLAPHAPMPAPPPHAHATPLAPLRCHTAPTRFAPLRPRAAPTALALHWPAAARSCCVGSLRSIGVFGLRLSARSCVCDALALVFLMASVSPREPASEQCCGANRFGGQVSEPPAWLLGFRFAPPSRSLCVFVECERQYVYLSLSGGPLAYKT